MTEYSSTYLSQCYYYYDNSNINRPLQAGEIIGIAIGSIFGFIILCAIICCCIKIRQRNKQM